MSITYANGFHHYKANTHHSPLGLGTILIANHPHSWAPSPHHQTAVFHAIHTIDTTTVLEPTATPMPIATSLGPITRFITIHTTTGTNIHTNAQPHHWAPSPSTHAT
ncbi:hypothetical protein Pmani_009859 [Petrolisthes manimaculis]|uniref:Uncharacterized protein n=1 Tax=Petrolisthes manimaculis TaxID=1843537 RepID=A0AAE1UGB3_9EUCA|nr:hypothetical protein Pmani_009859 [Petrolisthes manimaculis]